MPGNHHFLLFFVVQVHFKFHIWDLLDFGGTFVAYIPLSCYPWRCQSFSGQDLHEGWQRILWGLSLKPWLHIVSKSLMTVWVPRLVNTIFLPLGWSNIKCWKQVWMGFFMVTCDQHLGGVSQLWSSKFFSGFKCCLDVFRGNRCFFWCNVRILIWRKIFWCCKKPWQDPDKGLNLAAELDGIFAIWKVGKSLARQHDLKHVPA